MLKNASDDYDGPVVVMVSALDCVRYVRHYDNFADVPWLTDCREKAFRYDYADGCDVSDKLKRVAKCSGIQINVYVLPAPAFAASRGRGRAVQMSK